MRQRRPRHGDIVRDPEFGDQFTVWEVRKSPDYWRFKPRRSVTERSRWIVYLAGITLTYPYTRRGLRRLQIIGHDPHPIDPLESLR